MPFSTARQRLAARALRLKKAWIFVAAMVGRFDLGEHGVIPDYERWPKLELEQQVENLESDLMGAIEHLIKENVGKVTLRPSVEWLAQKHDEWQPRRHTNFTIGTIKEFGENVAPLIGVIELMDAPPYSEMLLQPGLDVAFRHPEYMLSRDLEFLYELYLDTDALLATVKNWYQAPRWAVAGAENIQTLGRTVILSCFNLVESFISGLARAHVMETPGLDDASAKKLLDTHEPLRKRVIGVPRVIVGREVSLDINKPPFSVLFGVIKAHRDAYVHCEPGPMQSERGHHKETLFHDVSPTLVEMSVKSTIQVIRLIWKVVHNRDGPGWLHDLDQDGHFKRANLTIAPRSGESRA